LLLLLDIWCCCSWSSLCPWLWLALLFAELIEPEVLLPTELRLWCPMDIFLGMGSAGAGSIIDEEDGRQRRNVDGTIVEVVEVVGVVEVVEGSSGVPTSSFVDADDSLLMRSQGCLRMSSSFGLLSGGTWRHCLMRSWHSWDNRTRKRVSALQICSSRSKGMSPQTMS
jgi:hypothetical protein